MKRRDFLIAGGAALVTPVASKAMTRAAYLNPQQAKMSPLESSDVIWAALSVPAPLLGMTSTDAIASLASKISTPDLHCVFAKEFKLGHGSIRSQLHLFAFTRYRLYINGNYVGRGPCRYQNQRPEYDTYDLSSFLRTGSNVIAVLVHRDAPSGRIMQHEPGFVAALEIEQAGRKQVIKTDNTWLSMPDLSFQSRANAWSSIEEHIDARKTPDWTLPNLAPKDWHSSVVVSGSQSVLFYPRSSPKQSETELPWTAGTVSFPFDLVQEELLSLRLPRIAQAYHVLDIEADVGSELEVRYRLPEGESSGSCSYIARAGKQTYMGGDTFAFDCLELRLKSGRMRLGAAAACDVRYPFERIASFECSDPFLNQLWILCAQSLEVLSEDSYVDCADRERVEWTDDSPPAFDCTRVMMRGPDEDGKVFWSDSRILRGLLRRIALTQQPDGQLKAHSCSERFDIHAIMEDRSCDWVVLLREYYESSGDGELVRELWPTLTRLMAWYRQRRTSRGLTLAREWEVWDNPLRYQVCEGAGLNAMVYRALIDAAAMAKSLGMKRDYESLQEEANTLHTDFNQQLWNAHEGAYDGALFGPNSEIRFQLDHPFQGKIVDGRFGPTVQGNLFALYAGIVPEDRLSATKAWVLAHQSDLHAPMSFYYFFKMLYSMSEQQELEVLASMRKHWQNQVDSEWQTSWEDFDNAGASRVHCYGMHPGYFLTAFVLGARREGPVEDKTLLIEPRFSGLEWARGVCVTEFGPVRMDWEADTKGISKISCTLPLDISAKLRLRLQNTPPIVTINGEVSKPQESNGWLEMNLSRAENTILIQNSKTS